MFAVFAVLSPALLVAFVQGERIHNAGKFEIAIGSQAEAGSEMQPAAEKAMTPPPFDPRIFNSMLRPFIKSAPQPCGTRLLTTVLVNDTMKMEIIQSTQNFFAEKGGLLVAVGDGWKNLSPNHQGMLPVLDGHHLDAEGKDMSLTWIRNLITDQLSTGSYMRFTFYVGIDMRNCWPGIYDLTNREVCGPGVLQGLLQDMANVEPIFDQTGQSGSTIVTNVEGFIVKNTKDANEYETLREVMTSWGSNIRDRQKFSCFASALAPICVAFQLPSPQGDVQWMAMRKIEIPGARGASVILEHEGETVQVKDIDLKGPKFANSLRDGKTFFGSSAVWTKKDTGFAKMFPQGLKLRGCGSRDAAHTLELDTELLLSSKMTDYSLYGKFYALPPEDKYNCICENSNHSTFPLILDAEKGINNVPIRVAVGIIDYLEKHVHVLDKFLPTSMSTMKKPKLFKEWWMRMWPSYFHLPNRQLNKESGLIPANDHAPAEIFKSGQRVRALMKIKWFGGKTKHRTTKSINGKTYKAYTHQIPETSSESFSSGSKYKIIAGNEGTIVSLEDGYLYVHWDMYQNEKKIHNVMPDQIIGDPPIFG